MSTHIMRKANGAISLFTLTGKHNSVHCQCHVIGLIYVTSYIDES